MEVAGFLGRYRMFDSTRDAGLAIAFCAVCGMLICATIGGE